MASYDEKIDACYDSLQRLVKKFIKELGPDHPLSVEAENKLKEHKKWLAQDG